MIELITQLKNDHEHGSKDIALHLLRDCRDCCTNHAVNPHNFLDFLNQVDAARPSMVILQNITQRLRIILADNIDNANQAIISGINLLLKELELSEQHIFERTKAVCQKRHIHSVLTHSRSSTVEHILKRLGKAGVLSSVICTESRPLNEGVALANALSAYLNTTIIVDALVDTVMQQCDCVLLGADAMDSRGNILNKIGSRLLALSAKDHGIPVICLAESMKIHPTNLVADLPGEFHSGAELGHTLHNDILVTNQYFEVVEKALLSKTISDQDVINS